MEPKVWLSRFCRSLENLKDLDALRLKLATHNYGMLCGSLMPGSWFCLNPASNRLVTELPSEPIFLQTSIRPNISNAVLNCVEMNRAFQVELWIPPAPPIHHTAFVWQSHFISIISPWINVDSSSQRIRELSTQALKKELDIYQHVHTRAVVVRLRRNHVRLADMLVSYLHDRHLPPSRRIKFWMLIEPTVVGTEEDDTWEWWRSFRTRLGNSENVQLCLEVGEGTRLDWDGLSYLRWMSEPVATIFLHQGLFHNAGGVRRLREVHQLLIQKFFAVGSDMEARVILAPVPYKDLKNQVSRDLQAVGETETTYVFWLLNKLLEERKEHKGDESRMGGHKIRAKMLPPLMPLSDNLESSTYESFETDHRKYRKYMVAIRFALSSFAFKGKSSVRVLVLGAGRGRIVEMVRMAMRSLHSFIKIDLYAVEKNPHAIRTLLFKNEYEWNFEVEVIQSDMRSWFPDWKAELVVSELIGGFADNELSPECLDSASHLMDENTVSIPAWYQSILAPVQAPRMLHTIHRKSAVSVPTDKMWVSRVFDRFHLDIPKPYPAVVFRYEHPAPAGGNEKYGCRVLNFQARETGEVSGFAGFMDVGLLAKDHQEQDGIFICTYPDLHSHKLHSWFPTYFPLQTPVYVKKGQEIRLEFSRLCDAKAVWYEWRLLKPKLLDTQNLNGHAFRIQFK